MQKSTLVAGIVTVVAIGAAVIGLLPFWLLIIVAFGLFLVRGYGRAKQVNTLVDNGVPATATVIKKLYGRKPIRDVHVWYAFETAQGKHEARTEGSREDLDHLAVGDRIEILYLPDQPKVSAPKWVVAQGRQARAELAARAARGSAKE